MTSESEPFSTISLDLDAQASLPLYRQLYDRVRAAILSGQLPPGARLPSTRALATTLGVSRSTTVLAYEQLVSEGFLSSQVGEGTRVSPGLPAPGLDSEARHSQAASPSHIAAVRELRISKRMSAVRSMPYVMVGGGELFQTGQPALDLFPYSLWTRLVSRRARHMTARHANYQHSAGYPPLREAIAAHIAVSRGVRCTPDQIIVTTGTQGGLDLAARVLLDPGDAVWLENPGYFGAFGAFSLADARLIPVPVDERGLDVEAGRRLCPDARLVMTTPSHQFPTGVTMNLERRLSLLDWARQQDSWILEDDYDSEFRFTGRPLEALQALDRNNRVLYLGSFSKTLFPALRLGYIVAPPELVEPLLAARRALDFHAPILEQLALTDFIAEGHYARHLRRMRRHYRRRRDCLVRELETHLGDLLEVSTPEVGMQIVGWLPAGVDDLRAVELAASAGLRLHPLSRCSLTPLPRGGLVFGFASVDEEGIRGGVAALADALKDV